MKKCFIIQVFKKVGEGMKYIQNINAVFETRDLAKGYTYACDEKYKYVIVEVDFYKQYETK